MTETRSSSYIRLDDRYGYQGGEELFHDCHIDIPPDGYARSCDLPIYSDIFQQLARGTFLRSHHRDRDDDVAIFRESES